MINVLVTGGQGQLASCIKDVEVEYDNLNIIYTDSEALNICNVSQVQSFFKSYDIDYCINCAAYTAVDKAEEEKELAFKVNAEGPKNLALACKEHNVVLIHISTDFVFDGTNREPYTEEDKTNPISVYGASKLQGEIEIQNILEEHFIIRTSWLYSEYGYNFMKTMLRLYFDLSTSSRQAKLSTTTDGEISVVSDQIGTPTYAGDLAMVILEIINRGSKAYGLYHYSHEGAISWYDFAKAIFEFSNILINVNPISTAAYPRAAKRPPYSVLNKAKIRKTFNVTIPDWHIRLKQILEGL
ncbi:dTDP-4-dehydrorhamnose reductase [Aestuariibaculum suncheonense]|uniref:dTDP-4-dehydrorhamnose reductase n=1 Tax=Aestuariibaculum suncheonense TaxID=1028745 RepID=A0A8J6UIS4_9FLAO|nr:dTDP-4-dehydrorhamnose reductase [Aestuariibaculum suncheonense]MBD0836684.1 dTDP-4-dehydrorhamnose reductase [Aestuariibaculum suncheonense]